MQINKSDAQFITKLYQEKDVISVRMLEEYHVGEIAYRPHPVPGKLIKFVINPETGHYFEVVSKFNLKEFDESVASPFIGSRYPFHKSGFADAMIRDLIRLMSIDEEDCENCDKREECESYNKSKEPHRVGYVGPVRNTKDKKDSVGENKKIDEMSFTEVLNELFGGEKTDDSSTNRDDADRQDINDQKANNVTEIYVVTNFTQTGEYTPSVFSTFDEARDFLMECTTRNILGAVNNKEMTHVFYVPDYSSFNSHGNFNPKRIEITFENNDENYTKLKAYNKVAEFLRYVENNLTEANVSVGKNYTSSTIDYADDTFNGMNIYKININNDGLHIEQIH